MKKNNLNTLNESLFNSLNRLNELDISDVENAKTEIARSNAISQTGKTLIQSIGVQIMVLNSERILSKDLHNVIGIEERK